jgi:hypothetical protein
LPQIDPASRSDSLRRQLKASERALGEELVQVGQGGGGVGVVLVEPESDRQVDIDCRTWLPDAWAGNGTAEYVGDGEFVGVAGGLGDEVERSGHRFGVISSRCSASLSAEVSPGSEGTFTRHLYR